MLFYPWTEEDDLRNNYMSYGDKYSDCIDDNSPGENRFIPEEKILMMHRNSNNQVDLLRLLVMIYLLEHKNFKRLQRKWVH